MHCLMLIFTCLLNDKTEREHARNSFGILPQGCFEQKPLNLEKTTSSVLSVLSLIYADIQVIKGSVQEKELNSILIPNNFTFIY